MQYHTKGKTRGRPSGRTRKAGVFNKWRSKLANRGKKVVPKGLRQAQVPIKRTLTYIVDSSQPTNLPADWALSASDTTGYHAILSTQVFQLSQLPGYTNIINLFQYYKINCIIVKIFPCYSTSIANGAATSQSYQGQNIMVNYEKNQTGTAISTTIDDEYWAQRPARGRKIITGRRPLKFKVYPKLLNEVYSSLTNTDYTLMKPKWIATNEVSTPHFGLNMAFSFVDTNDPIALAANSSTTNTTPVKFRIEYDFLMSFKGYK